MDLRSCAQCGKLLKPDARGAFCGQRCIWRAWYERSVANGNQAQRLPLATLPPDAEDILPATGPERLRVALQLALLGRAPADARGYRVGIKQGSRQLMRWFPPVRFRTPALFLLDPFEWPTGPRPGIYAVVYLDGRLVPIGGPRFTIAIGEIDRRLLLSDGDRTYKPLPPSQASIAGKVTSSAMPRRCWCLRQAQAIIASSSITKTRRRLSGSCVARCGALP